MALILRLGIKEKEIILLILRETMSHVKEGDRILKWKNH